MKGGSGLGRSGGYHTSRRNGQITIASPEPKVYPTTGQDEPEAFLRRPAHADLLRDTIGFAAQRLKDVEVGGVFDAARPHHAQCFGSRRLLGPLGLRLRSPLRSSDIAETVPSLATLTDDSKAGALACMNFCPRAASSSIPKPFGAPEW